MKNINFLMYQALNTYNIDYMESLIFDYLIDKIDYKFKSQSFSKDKGLISLILSFAIIKSNDDLLNLVKPYLTMKRDFYSLMKYYQHDINYCKEIFINNILKVDEIISYDLEFIIENNFYYLLPLLQNKFIRVNLNGSIPNVKLNRIPFENNNYYIEKLKSSIPIKTFNSF